MKSNFDTYIYQVEYITSRAYYNSFSHRSLFWIDLLFLLLLLLLFFTRHPIIIFFLYIIMLESILKKLRHYDYWKKLETQWGLESWDNYYFFTFIDATKRKSHHF